MADSTANFGVGTRESYTHETFMHQLTDGQVHWDARMVLFDFFYAYECGYVKNFKPSPGFTMSEERVTKCIKKLDYEWNKEAISRAGKIYTGGAPKFEDILEEPQKLALVEALTKFFPDWYENIGKREQAEAERLARQNYFD